MPSPSMTDHKVFGIVGWKNSGKTTLVEALVSEFVRRGLRVSTIKHAHHDFDIDHPGKDSHRHRAAGASEVLVASRARWALMSENRDRSELDLPDLLARLSACDIVLVEGYKRASHPKIEVLREAGRERRLADQDSTVIAIATTHPDLAGPHPALPLNQPTKIADFICDICGIQRQGAVGERRARHDASMSFAAPG